jgi:hypothetical protein
MRTVLPNAEKSSKPVLPFGLLESSPDDMMPRRHTLARAISKTDQRFLCWVPDAQEDGLHMAECQAT